MFDRVEEGQDHHPVLNGSGELLAYVDLDVGDAEFSEAEAELLSHARRELGVPEMVGSRKSSELGAVMGDKLLLGRGGHGYDGGGGWVGNLGNDFPAR